MKKRIFKVVLTALYMAILLTMNFTPIGYIPTGAFNITLLFLPVILAAITLGPAYGGLLGALFGLTSFLQAFGIGFVIDPSAALLFTERQIPYTLMCFLPRIVMGVGVGFIFKALSRRKKDGILSYAVSSASAVVLNTLLFMSAFYFSYKGTVFGAKSLMAFLLSALTLNFVFELLAALILGTLVSKAVVAASKRYLK